MSEQTLVIIFAGTAVMSMLLALILQRRSCRRLKQLLAQYEEQPQPAKVNESFSQNLARAESQNPLPTSPPVPGPHQIAEAPDRYRYISAMARQGMQAAQIAAALQISEIEAAQIVRLTRLEQAG